MFNFLKPAKHIERIEEARHTYVRLKALSHPGAQQERAAFASRKPLAPDGKNGNKALRQMHPQGE